MHYLHTPQQKTEPKRNGTPAHLLTNRTSGQAGLREIFLAFFGTWSAIYFLFSGVVTSCSTFLLLSVHVCVLIKPFDVKELQRKRIQWVGTRDVGVPLTQSDFVTLSTLVLVEEA